MPDNPFDRVIINSREKPVSEDINKLQSQLDQSLRFFAKSVFSGTVGAPMSGFLSGGFSVVESSPQAMSVILKAGLGFQDDQTDVPGDVNAILGLDDFESYKPLPLLTDLTIAIPIAPVGPNTRIDIIEVRADRLVTDNQGREIFNITTEEFQNGLVDKTMEFFLSGSKFGSVADPTPSTSPISLKTGVAANPGVAPTPTAGYLTVAEIAVGSGVVVIANADITDSRSLLRTNNGDQILVIPSASGFGMDATGTVVRPFTNFTVGDFPGRFDPTALSDIFVFPISLLVGDRVKSIKVFYDRQGGTEEFEFVSIDNLTGTRIDHEVVTEAVAAGLTSTIIPVSPQVTITSGRNYWFQWDPGSASCKIYSIEITYDHP